jgi:hypothetical protein
MYKLIYKLYKGHIRHIRTYERICQSLKNSEADPRAKKYDGAMTISSGFFLRAMSICNER